MRKWQQAYIEEKEKEYRTKPKKRRQNAPYSKFLEEEEMIYKRARQHLDAGDLKLPKGSIIKFDGAINTDTRLDIRNAVFKLADYDVAYIEYQMGDKSGFIRFANENLGQCFMDKLTDNEVIALPSYWIKFILLHL